MYKSLTTYIRISHTAKQGGSKSAVEHVPAGSGVPKTSHAPLFYLCCNNYGSYAVKKVEWRYIETEGDTKGVAHEAYTTANGLS